MIATSTELLRIVSSLDSVDFSSIKSFISQPFRYSPVFCSFGLSPECNMYEGIVSKNKSGDSRFQWAILQFWAYCPSPCHE